MKLPILIYVLLLCGVITNFAIGHVKLNVPRVRLPYFDTLSVNFTLQVDTPGCYKWTVSRSNVVTLTALSGHEVEGTECSDAVLISAVPRVIPCCPAHAIVYAEEVHTKETVRCDVIIDRITSINIVTTTKELHLEEAPSKYNVRGYGGQGNEFSTLEGVPFKWWYEVNAGSASVSADPMNILRFIPFSESMYKVSTAISELELRRLQGSQVLVEGLKTGSANIFAKIGDQLYKNIQPAEVRIVVIANLVLEPREIYVVPGTTFLLQLLQLKQGQFVQIKLPSPIYTFEVSNKTVVKYDIKSSVVTALKYGDSKIVVKDKNSLDMLEDEEHPDGLTTNIYVREPKFLSLTVLPYRNLALVIGQQYEIVVEIYDSDNQKIYVGDRIHVKTVFDSDFLNIGFSSENGTYHLGTPVKDGVTRVTAQLDHIRLIDGSSFTPQGVIRVQMEVEIFQPIVINPKESILPWDPIIKPKHEIRFIPSGGSGTYTWSSSNYSVAIVTQGAVAKTESLGFTNITAAMSINSNIKGHSKIYVLSPTSMKIVDHIVEAEVGSAILVPLAFYTTRPDDKTQSIIPYTSCTMLPFKVEVDDSNFYYDSKTYYPHLKPACAYLPIIGRTLGSSLVTVSYTAGEVSFMDSVIVSTFKPLKVVEPASLQTVLAVGSSRQLVFEGGPRPLLERSSGYFRTLHVENETVAQFHEFKPLHGVKDDLYVYEVICREIGSTDVTIETGNSRHKDDARPLRRTASVHVICGEPAQIYFKVESLGNAELFKCPLEYSSAQVVRIPVPNYDNTLVSVTVKDFEGRKFDNITSLVIKWESNAPLVSFKHQEYITTMSVPTNGYINPGKSFQTVIPHGESGNVEITSTIMGYRADIVRRLKIRSNIKLSKPTATDDYFDVEQRTHSMELNLVSDVSVDPAKVVLFNHPSYKIEVRIKEGSGYFTLNSSNLISKFIYHENNKTILISPLNEGEGRISVQDLCLPTGRSVDISIRVNGVGTLEAVVPEKLEVGEESIANVRIYGKNGDFLSSEDLALIKLKPVSFNSDILDIKQIESRDTDSIGVHFKIKGKNVGQTSLAFVADSHGKISRSVASKITVFSPLVLSPANLTILVGSVYQFIAQGGPQLDTLTNFTIISPRIASVSITGLIQGLVVGKTQIEAKSVDRISSGKVYSEDIAHLNVVPFKGVRIHAPLTKIVSNYEMPFWAVELSEGLEPSILVGDKYPFLSFDWQISNRETAEIYTVFQKYGYTQAQSEQISIRFKGKQPGHVTVKLTANYSGSVFVDEIEIEVLEELKLSTCSHSESRHLLMTPNSVLNLRTNRVGTEKVVYAVQSSQDFGCLERGLSCANMNQDIVTVDSSGLVRSFDSTGVAMILIYVREESGFIQSITITIEVKPVRYMMINPKLPVYLQGKSKLTIPRGITFPMSITYHDNIGRTFDSTNILAKARPNRFDLVQLNAGLENNSFVAQSLAEGRISVKMFAENNDALRDYLILSIAEAIDPKLIPGQISVGDVLCFSCSVKSLSHDIGHWVVDPTDFMDINQLTGIGVPLKPGPFRLEYVIPGVGSVTSMDFSVKALSRVSLQNTWNLESLTNGDDNAAFDVAVVLGGKGSNLYGSNCTGEIIIPQTSAPFICEMDFEDTDVAAKAADAFSIESVFRYDNSRYACRIRPIKFQNAPFYMSTVKSSILVKAKLKPSATEHAMQQRYQETLIESSLLKLEFHPAIFCHTTELYLSNRETHSKLAISGLIRILDQLKFIPSDGSYLKVEKGQVTSPFNLESPLLGDHLSHFNHNAKNSHAETRTFKVVILDNFWTSGNLDQSLSITIVSPLTKEKIQIHVKVKLTAFGAGGRTELEGWWSVFGFFQDVWTNILSAVIIVIITLVLVHYGSKYLLNGGFGSTSVFNESESVFISSPRADSTHLFGTKKSFSPNLGSSGDAGYSSSQRLFSTQDTGLYGSSSYHKRTPS